MTSTMLCPGGGLASSRSRTEPWALLQRALIEAQKHKIGEVGYENYLAQQFHGKE